LKLREEKRRKEKRRMQFEELLIPNIIKVTKSVKMRQEGYVT
jgi:hypothetical protein